MTPTNAGHINQNFPEADEANVKRLKEISNRFKMQNKPASVNSTKVY